MLKRRFVLILTGICISVMNLVAALLLQPPTDQQREWIEAFGLAWGWTDVLYREASIQIPEQEPPMHS